MENIFKYIKIKDINPTLRINEEVEDSETDAEIPTISDSEDNYTSDEGGFNNYNYYISVLRKRNVLYEIKINKLEFKNKELNQIIIDKEKIISNLKTIKSKIKEENKQKIIKTTFIGITTGFIFGILTMKIVK